jgi:hypothetical protein
MIRLSKRAISCRTVESYIDCRLKYPYVDGGLHAYADRYLQVTVVKARFVEEVCARDSSLSGCELDLACVVVDDLLREWIDYQGSNSHDCTN